MLDDYNSSTCVMKEKNTTSGMAHVCSCSEEECNDKLFLSPSEYRPLTASSILTLLCVNTTHIMTKNFVWLHIHTNQANYTWALPLLKTKVKVKFN